MGCESSKSIDTAESNDEKAAGKEVLATVDFKVPYEHRMKFENAVKFFQAKKFNTAFKFFEELLPELEADEKANCFILYHLGMIHSKKKRFKQSRETLLEALDLQQNHLGEAELMEALIYEQLGRNCLAEDKENTEEAQDYYEKAIDLGTISLVKRAQLQTDIGHMVKSKGDLEKSLEWYEQALVDYGDSADHAKSRVLLHTHMASTHALLGDDKKALRVFEDAVEIAQLVREKKVLASVFHNMGQLFDKNRQWEESAECYSKALALLEDEPSSVEKALMMNNQATALQYQGDLDDAWDIYEKALKVFKKHKFQKGIDMVEKNMDKLDEKFEK